MINQEINNKLKELQKQLDKVIANIQAERQESKEDETTVIDELMINKGILEEQIEALQTAVYNTGKLDPKKYVLKHQGKVKQISIVHEHLADSSIGKISRSCPLALALKKARVGEKLKISTPLGETEYLLLGIE
jgi:transcription elongation GreA/GreB family factor